MPICELEKEAGFVTIAQTLDIHITKLILSLNVKHTMNEGQIKVVVEDLLDKYRNESLEDFILVFKKARQNEFGDIYRLDSAVIFGWMDKYLEEKYQVIESNLMKEKEGFRENRYEKGKNDSDWLTKWFDSVKNSNPSSTVSMNMSVYKCMSEKEIREEGQEKPKANFYPKTSISELRKRELHWDWIRNNFDPRTGDKLEHWMPEDQWIELQKM